MFSSQIMRLKERYSRPRLKTRDWKKEILFLVSKVEIDFLLDSVLPLSGSSTNGHSPGVNYSRITNHAPWRGHKFPYRPGSPPEFVSGCGRQWPTFSFSSPCLASSLDLVSKVHHFYYIRFTSFSRFFNILHQVHLINFISLTRLLRSVLV